MRSSFPLNLLYLFLKLLVRVSLGTFYPYTAVTGRQHLRLKGPTLLASNHPNTLPDPLHGAGRVDKQVFFLINAGMLRAPLMRRLFETLYCIPVERPQDTNGRPINNTETFARCDEHLHLGGNLFIAPEGGSEMERRLRPLKTGLARIAFSAESKYDYKLNVRILPLGLNYDRPERFGSRMLINVGEPIMVSDFREIYEHNQREGIHALMSTLEERLRSLVVDTRDLEEDRLVRQLETLLRSEQPLDQEAEFRRTKDLILSLRRLESDSPAALEVIRQETGTYFAELKQLALSDRAVAAPDGASGNLASSLGLLLGFPAFLYGMINNLLTYFPPRWLAGWLVHRKGLYIGYMATVKILVGLITFSLFYTLQTMLMSRLFGWPVALVYLLSLVPFGFFAHGYAGFFRQTAARWRWQRIRRGQPERAATLTESRQKLLDGLKSMPSVLS